MKCLRKRKVPPVGTLDSLEESRSEDEQKIRYFVFNVFHSIIPFLIYFICVYARQRRRIPVAKANCHMSPSIGSLSPIGSGSPSNGSQGRGYRSLPYPLKKKNGIYKCNFCAKTCKKLCHLKEHLLSHKNERPFKCNICTNSFKQLCNLKRHLKLHTGEKPHQCDICKMRFTRSNNLKAHKLRHTKERPSDIESNNSICHNF